MKIKMLDGSIYEEKQEPWIKAIRMRKKEFKQKDKKLTWDKLFAVEVEKYFKLKVIPNKFGYEDPWDKNYKNHAELAPKIMYLHLRAILMGMAMESLGGGKVLALNKDGGVTEYPSGKKHKDIKKALKK